MPRKRARALTVAAAPLVDASLLNIVAAVAADPTADVAKLQALLAEQRRIVADDARLQYQRAMAAAQAAMPAIARTTANAATSSKYATLDAIDAAIRPIVAQHGFALEYSEAATADGARKRIVCEVSHIGGHCKQFYLDAALDTAGPRGNANKSELHGLGSMVSYLRRYLLCMIFNVVTGDDTDGNRRGEETGEVIGRADLARLRDLMTETRILETVVLAKMAPGVATLDALPAGDVQRILTALLSRRVAIARKSELGDALRASLNMGNKT